MQVPGHALDTVKMTTKTTGTFDLPFVENKTISLNIDRLMKSCDWLRESLNIARVTSKHPESTEMHQQKDRTPSIPSEHICNHVAEVIITTTSYMQQLRDLLSSNDEPNHLHWMTNWCSGRKFFSTQTGRFGLGPQDLEEGDLICALYAGRPLFVLRPVESQGELKKRHRIVGDAYVPGLMKGEGFRGKKFEDMQEFCLI
jgi:hypothetical protein